MEFSQFDSRKYRTVGVNEGYRQWAPTYDATVKDELDLRLLRRLTAVDWKQVRCALDLACGTGRIGTWLHGQGVQVIDGVDFTEAMLEQARARSIYRKLTIADVRDTGLLTGSYDLITQVLADEHLPDLKPLYVEAARLSLPRGTFLIIGYHSHFLLSGVPTHFDSASGEPVAVESYVHLMSDHVNAALAAGWHLQALDEGVVDSAMVTKKPKWKPSLGHPISFLMMWRRASRAVANDSKGDTR